MKLWPWSRKDATSSMDILRELFSLGSSKSGANVNWNTALECTVSLACSRVISEGIAQVPFKLFTKLENGGSDPASDHSLFNIITSKPNEWQTSFEYREQIGLHLVLAGNHFSFINRARGRIVELIPFEPGQITVKRNDDMSLSYLARTNKGETIPIPQADMWHLRGPSWNGWMGLDGVKLAREAIGLALATEEHGARLFSNGARPGGFLSTEATLDDKQRKAIRESFEQTYAGSQNAFKTGLLWGGLKFTPSAMPSDQAQFLETRRFQIEEVCRAFRVMPIMVGYSDKAATYASAEQMFLAHIVHTMGPWFARIEQSANRNLLTDEDRRAGNYTKFVVNGLLRGAVKDRAEFYTKMYGIGALNPNEIRELEEMNPYDGGEKYRVPLNMVDPNSIDPNNPNGDKNGNDATS